MSEELKKARDNEIDFPETFKNELEALRKENIKLTTEFLKFCEEYFIALHYIKINMDNRQQQMRKRQNIMERAFKKLRLDRSMPWQCDFETAQFYTINPPSPPKK